MRHRPPSPPADPEPTPAEEAIDRLYQLPLDEFVTERNETARRFRGHEARAIRALGKPNIVAWALNRVYWSARPVFDHLLQAANALRAAQAELLSGRPADLRGADAEHRAAVAAAVMAGTRTLEEAGHPVTPDILRSLTAAFEAAPWTEREGRLVRPPAAVGFGAFAGMPVSSPPRAGGEPGRAEPPPPPAARGAAGKKDSGAASRERQRELEALARRAREALDDARRATSVANERLRAADEEVARARDAERLLRQQLDEARRRIDAAEAQRRAAERLASEAREAAQRAEADAARHAGQQKR